MVLGIVSSAAALTDMKGEATRMEIKCGRRTFTVTEKDLILDNGATYQLITQKYFDGWFEVSPSVAKSTFNKLLKEGKIRLLAKQYNAGFGIFYPLYEFVIEQGIRK